MEVELVSAVTNRYRADPMERPSRFEHHRFLGDKRTQLVYDLDEWDDPAPIEEIIEPTSAPASVPTPWPRPATAAIGWPDPVSKVGAAPIAPELRMNGTFISAGHTLARHLVVPSGRAERRPGVILCHGFPIGPLDARRSAGTFPQLIERIAHDLGYVAMTFNFRGTGTSGGDFSLQGWIDDLRTAIDYLADGVPRPRSCCSARTPAARSPSASPPTTAGAGRRAAQPPGRLRRLGRPPAPVPRARPGDRGDPHARGSRHQSTSGAGRSAGSVPPSRRGGSRRDHCW